MGMAIATPSVVLEMPPLLVVGAAGGDALSLAAFVAVELVVALEVIAEVVDTAVETTPNISSLALTPPLPSSQ